MHMSRNMFCAHACAGFKPTRAVSVKGAASTAAKLRGLGKKKATQAEPMAQADPSLLGLAIDALQVPRAQRGERQEQGRRCRARTGRG